MNILNKTHLNMFYKSLHLFNVETQNQKEGVIMKQHASTLMAAMALFAMFTGLTYPVAAQYQDQQAANILEEAREHHEASIRNIDDYVVEYENYEASYVKRYDNGRPYMAAYSEPRVEGEFGSAASTEETDLFSPENFQKMKERARYLGTEELDGYEVHVLFIDELDGFIEDDEDMDETARELHLYLDTDNFVMRKMKFKVEANIDGEIRIIEPVMHFRDYREFEGMPVAFEQVTMVTGISDMITDEDRAEMEAAFEEMERELEQMPEQQRQMVEQMMGSQMEEMKEMLEADQWEHTMRVVDVRVNVGLE